MTGVLILLRDWWRDRSAAESTLRAEKRRAYEALLNRSGLLIHTAGALHATMEHRSGLPEGVDVALTIRKPADPLELAELMRQDTEPLYAAWTSIWAIGTDDAIAAANEVVALCGEVMGKATVRGTARVGVARWLIGEKWTPDQLAEWATAIEQLALARARLARTLRSELGVRPAAFLESFGSTLGRGEGR